MNPDQRNTESTSPTVSVVRQYVSNLVVANAVDVVADIKGQIKQPNVTVNLNTGSQKVSEDPELDGLYYSTINIDISVDGSEANLLKLNLAYSGVFKVKNVPESDIEPILLIYCPSILFPFVRKIVADATAESGFPALMLDMVDFAKMYTENKAKSVQSAGATTIQ